MREALRVSSSYGVLRLGEVPKPEMKLEIVRKIYACRLGHKKYTEGAVHLDVSVTDRNECMASPGDRILLQKVVQALAIRHTHNWKFTVTSVVSLCTDCSVLYF